MLELLPPMPGASRFCDQTCHPCSIFCGMHVQAQLAALPMQYADAYEGHLTDLRTLLHADLWADVQERAPL